VARLARIAVSAAASVMMAAAKLTEVALRAGVSLATAQGLAKSVTQLVGLVVHDIADPYFGHHQGGAGGVEASLLA
jgi:hypothetical protein